MRRTVLGRALVVAGLLALTTSLGTVAYAHWNERQHQTQQSAIPEESLPAQLVFDGEQASAANSESASPTEPVMGDGAARVAKPPTPAALSGEEIAALLAPYRPPGRERLSERQTEPPSPTAPASRQATPPDRAVWMRIPRIGVDAEVAEAEAPDGAYEVPAWKIGHHARSSQPGVWGNGVYNGHVESINAGHVFARLKELEPGDAIYVYTATRRYEWMVTAVRVVPNTDQDFFAPTADTRITLYTCTGQFNPLTHDYSHRLVVVGTSLGSAPRE